MPSTCGVSWSGTSSGKLDESAIPEDDFESHYLNAGDTKSDSSFPVVDAEGNLRAGNVSSAWDLRNQGEGVSEECLQSLANSFDETPLPESAYENSMNTVTVGDNETDGNYGMNLEFSVLPKEALSDGFNRYGIRVNDNGSVDARFAAMEPGERRGFKITEEFLRNVASYDYSRIPLQLDHSQSQRANVGYIEPENVSFNDTLNVQAHIPDTGSSVRNDIIADFTHEPPQIQDISVSYDPRSVEVEPPSSRNEAPEFVDARIREFSLTPFPAGYDNGGITPEFSAAVERASITPEEHEEPESQLIKRPHTLIRK